MDAKISDYSGYFEVLPVHQAPAVPPNSEAATTKRKRKCKPSKKTKGCKEGHIYNKNNNSNSKIRNNSLTSKGKSHRDYQRRGQSSTTKVGGNCWRSGGNFWRNGGNFWRSVPHSRKR